VSVDWAENSDSAFNKHLLTEKKKFSSKKNITKFFSEIYLRYF